MPVFSPQPKHPHGRPQNVPSQPRSLRPNTHVEEAYNGLIVYNKHKDTIDFSSSILDAMQAVAPVIVPELLKSSVWDGPKIFQQFILSNMPTHLNDASRRSLEKMYNEFIINTELYIPDPLISPTPGKIVSIVPNPYFNLSRAMIDTKLGKIPQQTGHRNNVLTPFVAKIGKEFLNIIQNPNNYGFSTTLIFPDQDILNANSQAKIDAAEIEKRRAHEEYIKILKEGHPDEWNPTNPYKKPQPWGDPTGPGAPWEPRPKPNPYDPYDPRDKNPYKWIPEDYDKYRSYLGKKKDGYDDEDRAWIKKQRAYYDKYQGASGASAASAAESTDPSAGIQEHTTNEF
jgi:hypothetical protein